jgi:hypothetical protein
MEDILNNREDMLNNSASQLIGQKFSEVRNKLSFWWVLEHQNIQPWGKQQPIQMVENSRKAYT